MADAHDLAEPAPQPVSIMLLVNAAAPISDRNVLLFMNGILSFRVFFYDYILTTRSFSRNRIIL
jgi:hypothetical protein